MSVYSSLHQVTAQSFFRQCFAKGVLKALLAAKTYLDQVFILKTIMFILKTIMFVLKNICLY